MNPSRRQFLRTSALAGASAALAPNALSATLARTLTAASMSVPAALASHRLSAGWEYHQGPLTAGDAWKPDDSWKSVTLPHCFNAYDACDPDTPYYRGQGWYRTHIKINNPYPNGRTLLHFEGAGQTSTLYVGNDIAGKYTGGGEELPRDGGIMGGNFTDFAGYMRVGKHIGGYDEFLLDITTAANETAIAAVNATPDASKLPVIVVCDNSHDDNRMPSDLSDFTLYGGLYRHVNLVYVPAVSVAKAHIDYTLPADKSDNTTAKVSVTAALYNPTALTAPLEVTVSISRLNGKLIATKKQTIAPWQGEIELTNITIPNPDLWSPDSPALYDCTVNIVSPAGVSTLHERFGVRRTELVEHGPFLLNGERLLLRGTQRHHGPGRHRGRGSRQPRPAGAAARQRDGRKLHPPRALPAVSFGISPLRRARPARLGRALLVPLRCRKRRIQAAGPRKTHHHDRPASQPSLRALLGTRQRRRLARRGRRG